jgi:hypothetical protein
MARRLTTTTTQSRTSTEYIHLHKNKGAFGGSFALFRIKLLITSTSEEVLASGWALYPWPGLKSVWAQVLVSA